jgi:hypothetical protein
VSIEIAQSRNNAWTTVASRHHQIEKVFVAGGAASGGTDLLVIGRLTARGKGEAAPVVTEFAGRAVVVDVDVGVDVDGGQGRAPRFTSYQAWVGRTTSIS